MKNNKIYQKIYAYDISKIIMEISEKQNMKNK